MTPRIVLLSLAASVLVAGCGPARPKANLQQVLACRANPNSDYNLCCEWVRDERLKNRKDKDYVMWAMEYASLCLMAGHRDPAKAELLECFKDIEQGKGGETIATITREDLKRFKGEPFERAMVCCYLGMLFYQAGDLENARVMFSQATMQDNTTAENMAAFREDFGLAYYFLGRCYGRQGKDDNCRIAFRKAGVHVTRAGEDKETKAIKKAQAAERKKRDRLEALAYKNATQRKQPIPGVADLSKTPAIGEMPDLLSKASADVPNPVQAAAGSLDEFLTPDFQAQANLILVIEAGLGPIKILVGDNKEQDRILRARYPVRQMLVYLNGHKAGPAFQMVDLFHQADTRGTSAKDAAQAAKAAAKNAMSNVPYASLVASLWDVRADDRYWKLAPGEVHVFAAKVAPGEVNATIQCFDSNGYLLPRYRLTRYALPVRAGQDNIHLLHVQLEADNVYVEPKK